MSAKPLPPSSRSAAVPDAADLRRIEVPDDRGGERLDRLLSLLLPDLSRSRLKALIEAGAVRRASGATIVEPSRKVKAGEMYEVVLPPPVPAMPEAQAIPLLILHEDSDLIVIDKPPGLVVHPAPGNADRTLVNALLAHCGASLSGIGGVRRPGIVHRLDKDTSGVMVAAKNDAAHHGLAAQFAAHSIERTYLAVTVGRPAPRQGRIEGNIGRHPRDRKRMAVVTRGGKPAATLYRVLEGFGAPLDPVAALVECQLLTGRTHQVRVHLASLGHPLVGDPLYGIRRGVKAAELALAATELGRQALHAKALAFDHPGSGKRLRFETDLPSDIRRLIETVSRPHGVSNIRED